MGKCGIVDRKQYFVMGQPTKMLPGAHQAQQMSPGKLAWLRVLEIKDG